MKHSSKPYNPKLANVFFKSGMIEAWGRGFEKIQEACALYAGPLPEYEIDEAGIMVLCKACDKYLALLRGDVHKPVHNLVHGEQDNCVHYIKRDCSIEMIEIYFSEAGDYTTWDECCRAGYNRKRDINEKVYYVRNNL